MSFASIATIINAQMRLSYMNYDDMYDNAVSTEKRALGFGTLIFLVIATLMFFAGIFVKEPYFGIEVQILKNLLVTGSVLLALVGSLIPILTNPSRKQYEY
jgi:magnesium-transporting ATPase (P-type)